MVQSIPGSIKLLKFSIVFFNTLSVLTPLWVIKHRTTNGDRQRLGGWCRVRVNYPRNPMSETSLVHILPFTGAQWRYGFRTPNVESVLGHTEFTSRPNNVVIGVNSVKPPRASKTLATGLKSTFCSADRLTEARAADWDITPGRRTLVGETRFTVPVYVSITTGLLYAWRMRRRDFIQIPGSLLEAMGVSQVTSANRGAVFYGANSPKPPQAKFRGNVGTTQDPVNASFKSFIDPSKIEDLPEGFTVIAKTESESIT